MEYYGTHHSVVILILQNYNSSKEWHFFIILFKPCLRASSLLQRQNRTTSFLHFQMIVGVTLSSLPEIFTRERYRTRTATLMFRLMSVANTECMQFSLRPIDQFMWIVKFFSSLLITIITFSSSPMEKASYKLRFDIKMAGGSCQNASNILRTCDAWFSEDIRIFEWNEYGLSSRIAFRN